MNNDWIGENKEIVDTLIQNCNKYAATCKSECLEYDGIKCSYVQIQVMESLLEYEGTDANMSSIASSLGISRSNFTKIVNRLCEKGLVEKSYKPGNKKEISLTVTTIGRKFYEEYAECVLKKQFGPILDQLKALSDADKKLLVNAIKASMGKG